MSAVTRGVIFLVILESGTSASVDSLDVFQSYFSMRKFLMSQTAGVAIWDFLFGSNTRLLLLNDCKGHCKGRGADFQTQHH